MKKINQRDIHRTLGFFYVGLLISFAFSGILNNHRNTWDLPTNYTYDTKEFTIPMPIVKRDFNNKAKVAEMAKKWYPKAKFLGYRIKNNKLRAFYQDNTIVDLDLFLGTGEIEFRRKTPIIGHTKFLHKFTNSFWVVYSDIFAVSIIVIAITGMLLPRGKNSFKRKGWKIALLGMAVPIIVLLIFG